MTDNLQITPEEVELIPEIDTQVCESHILKLFIDGYDLTKELQEYFNISYEGFDESYQEHVYKISMLEVPDIWWMVHHEGEYEHHDDIHIIDFSSPCSATKSSHNYQHFPQELNTWLDEWVFDADPENDPY
ncbi:hypothetical protein AMR41_03920 [Hapalosiphon sp. MRB220]|nr:hypothetical protein AMR41_03920 [Hapalosiphon sp. MRB220]